MRRTTHISCCALVVAVVIVAQWIIHVPLARAADAPVTDYDKRAAATLYTAYDGRPTSWDKMTADSVKGLTRVEKSADGKLTYVMNFGAAQAGTDNRGYFRITKGEELPDAAKGGWTPHKVDHATGAEVFFKKVESNAGNYTNMAVRRKIGQVILTIAQRRPAGESLDAGATDVCKRFAQLLDAGKANGLFGGEIKMWLTSAQSQPRIGAGEPLPFALEDEKETELTIRIEVHDADGKAIGDIERISIKLLGGIGQLAKLKYKDKVLERSKDGSYAIEKPAGACNVAVIVPAANDEAVQDALFGKAVAADAAPAKPDEAAGGLGISVGPKFGK